MRALDDTLLMAYADGELDRETALEIETAARADTATRERIEMYLHSRSMIHAAYNQPLHEPAPLQASLVASAAMEAEEKPNNVVPLRRRPAHKLEPVVAWALAASIAAFVVGFGSGQSWEGATGQQWLDQQANDVALRQTVGLALEALPNGQSAPWLTPGGRRGTVTPVRTYVNDLGLYCRDYLLARILAEGTHERMQAACRLQAGEWLPLEDLATPDTGA